ncbi:hypothetical protein K1719_027410 [Acacia pycnantha]|nr:hypothetical protein K1719_027410 [Acacia pycnantha]
MASKVQFGQIPLALLLLLGFLPSKRPLRLFRLVWYEGSRRKKILGINQFARMKNLRLLEIDSKIMHSLIETTTSFKYENVTDVPSTGLEKARCCDTYRDQCGCCWAFSAGVDQGCEGGLMDDAFKFIIQNHGLTSEANYPYKSVDRICNANALKPIMGQQLRVSCGTEWDHGVIVIRYSVNDGTECWLVRNLWETEWGEEGYIMMNRNVGAKEGLCGIVMQASYPIA